MQPTILIQKGVTRHPLYRMKQPVDFSLLQGEHMAIVGPNGSGKSLLVDIITGKHPLLLNEVHYHFGPSSHKLVSDHIRVITFRDSYGDSDSTYYYQQRWNQHDLEETPSAGSLLDEAFAAAEKATGYGLSEEQRLQEHEKRISLRQQLVSLFHLETLLEKPIVTLSSGELRKFQLTKTLFSNPRLLIMDNPYIGLDVPTRQQLTELLSTLVASTPLQIIVVLSRTSDIPHFITHVVEVEDRTVLPKVTKEDYLKTHSQTTSRILSQKDASLIRSLPLKTNAWQTTTVAQFNKVSIRYGARTILKELSWTVLDGQRWALQGANGCGKSTLLSLVCADNPQAYACDIELFGHKRGSGESIWDIKKHIGYVSPEMHRAYLKDVPAIDIVGSGLSDGIGLYSRPKPEQLPTCHLWMQIMGIDHLADRRFLALSSGEQRLCLLARAFVKDPELLILDEPLHGLDSTRSRLVQDIINTFCERPGKTLIMVSHYKEELPECITHSLTL